MPAVFWLFRGGNAGPLYSILFIFMMSNFTKRCLTLGRIAIIIGLNKCAEGKKYRRVFVFQRAAGRCEAADVLCGEILPEQPAERVCAT